MSVCPKCGASVSMYDTGGNPWYACGSAKTFRSASCVDREPVATQLREAQQRIKRLEEAGDFLSHYLREMPYASSYLAQIDERILRINNWREAKEANL